MPDTSLHAGRCSGAKNTKWKTERGPMVSAFQGQRKPSFQEMHMFKVNFSSAYFYSRVLKCRELGIILV